MYISSACDAIAQYIENHFDECVEAAKGAIHISEV